MRNDLDEYVLSQGLNKEPLTTWNTLASETNEKYGTTFTGETLRRRFRTLRDNANRTDVKCEQNVVQVNMNRDGSFTSERIIAADESKFCDANFLLEQHGYDPAKFELVSAQSSKWDVGDTKRYASKIVARLKTSTVPTIQDIERMFEAISQTSESGVIQEVTPKTDANGYTMVLPISDLHLGMLSPRYDLNKATATYRKMVDEAIHAAQTLSTSRIVFIIGGDVINCDNLSGTTTKGTPQDNAADFHTIMETAYRATVDALYRLAALAPVDVICVPGNHDKTASVYLFNFCRAWFRNYKSMTWKMAENGRAYQVVGKTLLCFAHDANEKVISRLIADEQRDVWGKVTSTEVFLQHTHSEVDTKDDYHVRIHRLPAACETSRWAAEQGYMARPQCKVFWFDDCGLCYVHYISP